MKPGTFLIVSLLFLLGTSCSAPAEQEATAVERPNILFVISDDQSFPHASAYGQEWVQTPAFDRVAREGVLFMNGFAASPGCSPSRAALLTGRHCWQIGAAGTHASYFDTTYVTFPERLQEAGYFVGHTGKGWGPGNYQISGRIHNPAGPKFEGRTMDSPEGINNKDYAGNFEDFLDKKAENQPFCFWLGTHEPHRSFGKGLGKASGKAPEAVNVPDFLPDVPEIREDLLDYAFEIAWFDQHLGRAIELLEARGELDNTLIIVTSDNGMAFPRAKANVYEFGFHVPLAVRWGARVPGGRTVDDLVGFVDLAPTILEAAGVAPHPRSPMSGHSILNILEAQEEGQVDPSRTIVYGSRERHSSSRYHSLSYPQRALRTPRFLYIRNFKPERWPAGTPQKYGEGGYPTSEEVQQKTLGPMHGGYHDIDACPTLTYLIERPEDPLAGRYLRMATQKRPYEELFDIQKDPACLFDVAADPAFAAEKQRLAHQMDIYLRETGDPRVIGQGDIWETYPRFSRLRAFPEPDWAKEQLDAVPDQPWLEEHWAEQLKK